MRRSAKYRDAHRAVALMAMMITGAACSDTTNSPAGSGGVDADEGEGAFGTSGPETGADEDFDPEGSTGAGDDGAGETGGDDGTTGGSSGGFDPAPEAGPFPACPDDLPEGWIFCEDFEALGDPSSVFFDYADGEGNFTPEFEGDAASGVGAMRAHYREGVEAAGFLSVSFGANPINTAGRPGYAESDDFGEVYWRFRVKMQEGWPDAGPHNLTRVSAFAQADWGQAMVANISSNGDGVTLLGQGSSCVDAGAVKCAGIDDATKLEPVGTLAGRTALFSSEQAGEWRCVEAHVKLNTPGIADGLFEFWVDGNLEASTGAVDWRGEWSEFGMNLLTLENFWVGGAPADLDRWFDDLVISTSPIGC